MRPLPMLLIALLPLAAHASAACDNPMTTIELDNCALVRYQAKDKTLNLAYQAALQRLDDWIDDPRQRSETKQGLLEAQRLWVQFRDKDCGAVFDLWRQGTIRGNMFMECMSERTESRTKELESFARPIH